MPASHDIDVYGGDDFALPVTVKANGVAQDVSSWTFSGQVRAWPSGASLASFDVNTSQAASGTVTFSLGAATTAALAGTVESARYDIQVVRSGTVTTILSGEVTMSGDVTR